MIDRARLLDLPDAEALVPPDHRRAAVAIALRGAEVLLMKRAERPGDRWSGQISLPGGHAEPVDTDLAATAARETHEEVGVTLTDLVGALPPVQAKARGKPLPTTILPAVYTLEGDVDVTLGPEAQAAFWFPLDRAAAGDLDAPYRYTHGEVVVQLPSWRYDDHVVWGLTHCILTDLLGLMGR